MEGDAVGCSAQEGLTTELGLEDATPGFFAEILIKATMPGNQTDDTFRQMDVEIVCNNPPFGLWRLVCDQSVQEDGEVLFGAPRANAAYDRAGCNVEGGDQGLGAVADILILPPLDPARGEPQAGRGALKRLDAGHLVDRNASNTGLCARLSLGIDAADIGAFVLEQWIGPGGQPIADAMRLEIRFFLKTAPPSAAIFAPRCPVSPPHRQAPAGSNGSMAGRFHTATHKPLP